MATNRAEAPASTPGSFAPPRIPTLQFLSDTAISHQTQGDARENKVIHFHSWCTAQNRGGHQAGSKRCYEMGAEAGT